MVRSGRFLLLSLRLLGTVDAGTWPPAWNLHRKPGPLPSHDKLIHSSWHGSTPLGPDVVKPRSWLSLCSWMIPLMPSGWKTNGNIHYGPFNTPNSFMTVVLQFPFAKNIHPADARAGLRTATLLAGRLSMWLSPSSCQESSVSNVNYDSLMAGGKMDADVCFQQMAGSLCVFYCVTYLLDKLMNNMQWPIEGITKHRYSSSLWHCFGFAITYNCEDFEN